MTFLSLVLAIFAFFVLNSNNVEAQYKAYFESTDTAFCASVFKEGYSPSLIRGSKKAECLADIHNEPSASLIQYAVMFVSEPIKEPLARFLCAATYPSSPDALPCQSFCEDVSNGMNSNASDLAILTDLNLQPLFAKCNTYAAHGCIGSSANFDRIFRPSPLSFPSNRCEPYEGTICQGLFEYVFLPAHYSQQFLESQIKQASLFLPLAPIGQECVTYFSRYICARAFWPCHKHTMTTKTNPSTTMEVLLPQMADKTVCEDYNKKCSTFIESMREVLGGVDVLTGLCDAPSPIMEQRNCKNETIKADIQSFPIDQYTLNLSGFTINVPTHNFTRKSLSNTVSAEYSGTPIISCPSPLVLPDDPDTPNRVSDASCATPCPSLFFTDNEYRTADYLITIMSAIGAVTSLFMLLTWLCFEEKRKSIYVISFLSMGFLLSVAFVISSIAYFSGSIGDPIAKHYCYSNSQEISVEHGGWCVGQGFIIQFAVLSLAAWWSVSALDLWIKIVGNQRYAPGSREDLIQKCIYHFWGWGIPLILSLIALGTNSLGAGDLSTAFCFVHQRNNRPVGWATVFYPLGIYLVVGGGSMIWTIIVLVRSTRAVGSRSWKPYFGAISFVSIFIAIFVIILTYRILAFIKEDEWKQAATTFVTCLLVNNPLQGVDCGLKPESRPNLFLWYFTQFILSGFGFHSFMVYTFSKDNYLLWAARLGRWFNIQRCRKWGENTSEGIKYASQRTSNHTSLSGGTNTGSTKTGVSGDARSSGTTGSHKPGATARFNTFRYQNKNSGGSGGGSGWNNSNVISSHAGSSGSGSAALNGSSFQGEIPSSARNMDAAQEYEKPTDEPLTTDGGAAIEMTSYQRRSDVEGVQKDAVVVTAEPPTESGNTDDNVPLETDD